MKTLRVVLLREDGKSVAAGLEQFVVGQGNNDAEAVDALATLLGQHVAFGDFDRLPVAPAKYVDQYAASNRSTTTIRGEFLMHVRACY